MSTLDRILNPDIDSVARRLFCVRLSARDPFDEEIIWAWLQSRGGHISIRVDCIDFWVPAQSITEFLLRWPLTRRPDLDYV